MHMYNPDTNRRPVCVCVKWSRVTEKKLLDKDRSFSSDHSVCWLSQ